MLYDFSVFEKEKEEWERKTGRRAEKIGSSLCKRPLYQFRIGQGRRVFAVFACFHGMEWITSAVLMDYLRESRWEETWKQANTLLAVPMVNPDGVEISLHGAVRAGKFAPLVRRISPDPIHWQANARGVDLNHNFPAGWEKLRRMEIRAGYTGPSPTPVSYTHLELEKADCIVCLGRCCRVYPFHPHQGKHWDSHPA